MAWRMVRQPNALYARWSDPVGDFTHFNLSEAEAMWLCILECGVREGRAKMDAADQERDEHNDRRELSFRWNDCLDKIQELHGVEARRRREQKGF